jgi:hypothetical protein
MRDGLPRDLSDAIAVKGRLGTPAPTRREGGLSDTFGGADMRQGAKLPGAQSPSCWVRPPLEQVRGAAVHISDAAVDYVKRQVGGLLKAAEEVPASDAIDREFVQRCMFAMSAVGAVEVLDLLGLLSDQEAAAYEERLRGVGYDQQHIAIAGQMPSDSHDADPPEQEGAPPTGRAK